MNISRPGLWYESVRNSNVCDDDAHTLGGLGAIGEALLKVRQGHVLREGGYDGEYGTIRVV